MLATVTNRARGVRGFSTLDRGTVPLEPGEGAVLDLADHAAHRAWAASGEVSVAPLSDKEAKATRRRLDTETDERGRAQAEALAGLAGARPAERAP